MSAKLIEFLVWIDKNYTLRSEGIRYSFYEDKVEIKVETRYMVKKEMLDEIFGKVKECGLKVVDYWFDTCGSNLCFTISVTWKNEEG